MGPLRASLWAAVPCGTGASAGWAPAASLLRYLSGARHPRPPLPPGDVLLYCPRTALLSRSPAFEALAWASGGPARAASVTCSLMNYGGWDVVAAGDPSVSCDPTSPCPTWTWDTPKVLDGSPRPPPPPPGHLSPPWGQQPRSLLAALHFSALPSQNALSTWGGPWAPQPLPVSAPPEKMSPVLTILPSFCRSAGRPATSPCRPSLSDLLSEGQRGEAQGGKWTHLPGRWRSSPAHCCQLHLHRPGLGSSPAQQLPLVRPAATS